jgi:DNA-binding SARP family transcriptional activator/ABC-type branched-subunit amino acid transport system substrate-binding protein/DNA-binding beta-propeller fold protein YncE
VLRFNLLGRLEVVAEAGPLALPAGKQRALVAALLIDANRAASADRLIDRLWGERPPATAAKNLQVLVSQLRKALGEGAIETVSGGYVLHVQPGAVDSERFEALLERGRLDLAEGRPQAAQRTLEGALAIVRGAPYEDLGYEDFLRDEIDRLEQLITEAREERLEAMLMQDMPAQALPDLRKLAAEHPTRERTVTLLAAALARTGRRAEALELYDSTRRLLAEQVGIEPGERLRRLHATILESQEQVRADDDLVATRTPRRHRGLLLATGGGLLIAAAIVAAAVVLTRSDASGIELISPNAVASVDPATGRLMAQYRVGGTPTSVATDGSTIWALNADDGTISRIDSTGSVVARSPGHTPTDLAYAGGRLWITYADRTTAGGFELGIAQLDPVTLRVLAQAALPTRLPANAYPSVPLAVTDSAVYAIGANRVYRFDSRTLRQTAAVAPGGDALAAGERGVWLIRHGGELFRLDPVTLAAGASVRVPTLGGLFQLAAGGGAVWGADNTGLVWRIDPVTGSADSVRVGLSAGDVAYGGGEVWVASAVDGTIARIDPQTERVRRFAIGNAPQSVAVGGGRVVVTVAGGGGQPIVSGSLAGLTALPSSTCGVPIYGGSGRPDLIIASDLPLDASDLPFTGPMVQAVEFTLREHHFSAGRFRIAFQACDDSTPQGFSQGKCAANAASYAATPPVIGVIGTLDSDCAESEIPILNRSSVSMVSPTNSNIGLTKRGVGVPPGEPGSLYPTGLRSYLRAYPADDAQAVADALLLRKQRAHRVYVFVPALRESYGQLMSLTFAAVAPQLGMKVVGPDTPPSRSAALRAFVHSLKAQGVDSVFMAGPGPKQGGPPLAARFLAALRREYGSSLTIVADDGYLSAYGRAASAASQHPLAGIFISGAYLTDPSRQLPPAGRAFVRQFSATQPKRIVNTFTPYAAQATEVLLAAIAASDGTRRSVVKHLLGVRVRDGILGSFGFDRNGDMTSNSMPIFRVPAKPTSSGSYPVYALIQVPSSYTDRLFR